MPQKSYEFFRLKVINLKFLKMKTTKAQTKCKV